MVGCDLNQRRISIGEGGEVTDSIIYSIEKNQFAYTISFGWMDGWR